MPLEGGISAVMTALEVGLSGDETRTLVVRQHGSGALRQDPHAVRHEYQLLRYLHAQGLAVPEPLFLDTSRTLLPTPYFVMDYVDGTPDFAPQRRPQFFSQLAVHLHRIHREPLVRPELCFLHRQQRDLSAIIHPAPARPDESLAEGLVRGTLEKGWPVSGWNRPTLLHGDYWPGNVLWRGETLVAVVDWEDAIVGEPLMDLATSRLDIAWIFGLDAMDAFTQEYLFLSGLDATNLPVWDLVSALRFVRLAGSGLAAWASFYPPRGRSDITEHTIRTDYHTFLDRALQAMPSLT